LECYSLNLSHNYNRMFISKQRWRFSHFLYWYAAAIYIKLLRSVVCPERMVTLRAHGLMRNWAKYSGTGPILEVILEVLWYIFFRGRFVLLIKSASEKNRLTEIITFLWNTFFKVLGKNELVVMSKNTKNTYIYHPKQDNIHT
jgi:hypothetical protein